MKQYFRMDMPNTLAKTESEVNEQIALGRLGVIRNRMLGEFNEDGVYVITDAVRKQLLTMHKYLVERYSTQCLIESEYVFGKRFYFSLKVEDNIVTFALLEKMRYGTNLEHKSPYCNIHTTILDQVNFDKLPDVKEETLFKRYNVSIADQPKSTKLEDLSPEEVDKYFEIIDRKMQLELLNKDLEDKDAILERAEQDYYVAQMQALKKCGTYGKQVIDEMEHTLITVRPFLDPNRKGYYKALNQIISTITYANRTTENEKEYKEFEERVEKPRKNYAQVLISNLPDVRPTLHGANERKQTVDQIVQTYLKKQAETNENIKSNPKIDEMIASTPQMTGERVRSRVVNSPTQTGTKTQTIKGQTKSAESQTPKGKTSTMETGADAVKAGVAVAGAKVVSNGVKNVSDTAKVTTATKATGTIKSATITNEANKTHESTKDKSKPVTETKPTMDKPTTEAKKATPEKTKPLEGSRENPVFVESIADESATKTAKEPIREELSDYETTGNASAGKERLNKSRQSLINRITKHTEIDETKDGSSLIGHKNSVGEPGNPFDKNDKKINKIYNDPFGVGNIDKKQRHNIRQEEQSSTIVH